MQACKHVNKNQTYASIIIYMYTYIYIDVYVYMDIYMYIHVSLCMYACAYTSTHTYIYMYIYTHTHTSIQLDLHKQMQQPVNQQIHCVGVCNIETGVAVKESKLSCHNTKTIFFGEYPYSGNLNQVTIIWMFTNQNMVIHQKIWFLDYGNLIEIP